MVGFDTQNKNTLDKKFICPLCSFILHDPAQLNSCGHRLCQSCLHTQHQYLITCPQCRITTPRDEIMLDRGFAKDMQSLSIICSHCHWTGILKNYPEHLQQSHPNPKCDYCCEQFTSFHQLNQHKSSQCQNIHRQCLLKDFGCHQQIARCDLFDHYLSEQHQQSIVNVIEQMKSQIRYAQMSSTQVDTDSISASLNQVEEVYETIHILASGSATLKDEAEGRHSELMEYEHRLQELIGNMSKVQSSIEEDHVLLEGIKQNLEILQQDLTSLEEKIDEMAYVSYDGTFTWKITNVQEKMNDAQSERQTSIYSPAFYSSPTRYKMRARRTHMSLFCVLMHGRNDLILKPFNYNVSFCLYDQTSNQRHIIDSFRPDVRSSSFQRPRCEMNIASGIPKFFPLAMIRQTDNVYIRDDTMFIKVMVDFGDMPTTLLPYAFSLNPGLPGHIQQAFIQQENNKGTLDDGHQ